MRALVCHTVLLWWSCTRRVPSISLVDAVKARLAPYFAVTQCLPGVALPDRPLRFSRGLEVKLNWGESKVNLVPLPCPPTPAPLCHPCCLSALCEFSLRCPLSLGTRKSPLFAVWVVNDSASYNGSRSADGADRADKTPSEIFWLYPLCHQLFSWEKRQVFLLLTFREVHWHWHQAPY